MGNEAAANQVLAVIIFGLGALWLLSFADCAFEVTTGPDEDMRGLGIGEPPVTERVGVRTSDQRVLGAYYPEGEEDGGSMLSNDLVLVGLIGLGGVGMLGGIAFVLFGGVGRAEPVGEEGEAPPPRTRAAPDTRGVYGDLGESDGEAWRGIAGTMAVVGLGLMGLLIVICSRSVF
ncbi:MAG: hypothetical protein H6736_05020 [Alphaproteobacteria bacterium]|nr:hypothetical protein [Alphaproteobacteria bacterium]MCB9691159.1 hypothetical protein [Alphaproteobacteria bacterium]